VPYRTTSPFLRVKCLTCSKSLRFNYKAFVGACGEVVYMRVGAEDVVLCGDDKDLIKAAKKEWRVGTMVVCFDTLS
jgi:hypothetical protein